MGHKPDSEEALAHLAEQAEKAKKEIEERRHEERRVRKAVMTVDELVTEEEWNGDNGRTGAELVSGSICSLKFKLTCCARPRTLHRSHPVRTQNRSAHSMKQTLIHILQKKPPRKQICSCGTPTVPQLFFAQQKQIQNESTQ